MRRLALLVVTAALAAPVWAESHSDGYCADSVDFGMRTVEHRDYGKTQAELAKSIHESPLVFKQQFPDLEEADMQKLVVQVFQNRWSRFAAAKATARDCAKHLAPPAAPAAEPHAAAPPAEPLAVAPKESRKRTDNWCADALDFAMGAAQNRELGYTEEIMSGSLDRNPSYYNRLFAELSTDDLKSLVGLVFKHELTRFNAARNVAEACVTL